MEMWELLRDNISLLSQLETIGGQSGTILPDASRPSLRDISSIASWMFFGICGNTVIGRKYQGHASLRLINNSGGTATWGPRLVRL